jgi:hypothetical protein
MLGNQTQSESKRAASLENYKQYLDLCYPSGKSLSEQHQMDRIHNEDIRIIWARHYPKRAERASSMSLCLTLAMIIRLRARAMAQYSDWTSKLQHVLADTQIPEEELLRSKRFTQIRSD